MSKAFDEWQRRPHGIHQHVKAKATTNHDRHLIYQAAFDAWNAALDVLSDLSDEWENRNDYEIDHACAGHLRQRLKELRNE